MGKSPSLCCLTYLSCLVALPLSAQAKPSRSVIVNNPPSVPAPIEAPPATAVPLARNASEGAISTRKDARTITLKIPAPRGQIVDREGNSMAQNRVAYQIALQFRQFENADRAYVLNWAHARLDSLPLLIKNQVLKTDDEIYDHYVNRRWLPLLVSGQIGENEAHTLERKLSSGLVLQPLYRRVYPEGQLAAHLIGYTGSVGKLPTGPINFNEPLWEESEGRTGFEKIYNTQLTGEPGMKRLLFDENGNKLQEEQIKRPRPGGTIVTTLNLAWQRRAEDTLRGGCSRGAFVVIDVITGEVLVMASRPSFDLNAFIPGINEKDFKALNEDPANPLYGRSFQGEYPPASSFKPIVALAALNNGTVKEDTEINCPAYVTIGNRKFKNWSKIPEGSINVRRALARSCNPWFYQVGIDLGPTPFLDLSRRFGFGERTGLPLVGEAQGMIPSEEWMMATHKHRIYDGDTANFSIGQGDVKATPLQVAQAMAGIANGGILPKLQLVSQVQDTRGRVVSATLPERKNWLGVDKQNIKIVQKGMSDVVNGAGGTGHKGSLSYTTLCGKTGTAQWNKARDQRLAWFAGFLPRENPRYAFAVLYEGEPGEVISGGRTAAPMVRRFFEGIRSDIKETIEPPKKALAVDEDAEGSNDESEDNSNDSDTPRKKKKKRQRDAEESDPEETTPPTDSPETPPETVPTDPDGQVPPASVEPPAPPQSPRDGVLNTLPVRPLETAPAETPEKPKAAQAIPVGEDEVIDDPVEEP